MAPPPRFSHRCHPSLVLGDSSHAVSDRLHHDVFSLVSSSNAPATARAAAVALRHFDRFAASLPHRQTIILPAFHGDLRAALHNELTFMLFAAYLLQPEPGSLSARSANTVLSYVSLVRSTLTSRVGAPLVLPSTENTRWKRFVRGLRRLQTRERKERRGLCAAHLRRAFRLPSFSANTASAANVWAAVVTGWHCLTRPKELSSELTRADLSFHSLPSPHAVIRLRPLKKAPGQSKVPLLIAAGNCDGSDAYYALRRLVALDPIPAAAAASTPLFRHSSGRAFSPAAISTAVRHVAAAAGETDLHLFGGRSLRIGGATDLLSLTVPATLIQLWGRWSSDIWRVYSRVAESHVLDVSSRLASAHSGPTLEARFPDYVQSARV